MKTKVLFIVCLFIGVIAMSAQAQDKAQRAVQGWVTGIYWSPVFCDGVQVDELYGGEIMVHYVFRTFKNGNVVAKEVDQIKGTVTSDLTGEVFQIREVDKYEKEDYWFVAWHYNLIGDQGSHYTGWVTYDYQSGEITIGHTTCN